MTIHKAQGATADRALLLADDTLSREHAYTGLSRGVVRNDLYLVVDDHRAEVRHAPEVTPEPDEAVRAAVRRSGSKAMAIDEVPDAEPVLPRPDRIEDLRHDLIKTRERLANVESLLAGSVARCDQAREELEHLPMGMPFTRQRVKAEREERLAAEEKDVAAMEPVVSRVRERCSTLERELRHRIVDDERAPTRGDLLAAIDIDAVDGIVPSTCRDHPSEDPCLGVGL